MLSENNKYINGHKDRYSISSDGRVYSHSRLVEYLKEGEDRSMLIKGRWLKHETDRAGYHLIKIEGKSYKVHRLVAIHFIPNPENKPQVNHIDGDKSNNDVSNLEWCTAKENIQHAMENGLMNLDGENSNLSKLTNEQVLSIRSDNRPNNEVYKDYEVSIQTIRDIRNRKTWKHI